MASDQTNGIQYNEILPGLRKYYDHYWSLPSYIWRGPSNTVIPPMSYRQNWAHSARQLLSERGYSVPPSTGDHMLHKLLERSERYLPHYRSCTPVELRTFVAARHLSEGIAITQHTRRSTLERLLAEADEDPMFERFLDLPPELRELIYEYYFANSQDRTVDLWPKHTDDQDLQPSIMPSETTQPLDTSFADLPPLLYCYHQVRAEALPVFWKCFRFSAKLTAAHGSETGNGSAALTDRVDWDRSTCQTFRLAHVTGMSDYIRSAQIHIIYYWGSSVDFDISIFTLDVDLRHGTITMTNTDTPDSATDTVVARLRTLVQPLLRVIMARLIDGGTLQLKDGKEVMKLIMGGGCLAQASAGV
ncbi:hypothetical protein B0A48_14966 [Cryoendolithus antarcticus]|uniref:2EXR domain-containing protein n=1 Tax=Cryoendolithus antarcticus TaxID=1507870 RepID=A0A1V8SIY4_9PEZI|nr:hypothetical protein B0A48_14966 [Cryoendolithus antarcticus]